MTTVVEVLGGRADCAAATVDGFYELVARVRPAWHSLAACRGSDPELFYAEGRGARYRQARALCAGCAVGVECAAAGKVEKFGVWAGLTPGQRQRLRRIATQNHR